MYLADEVVIHVLSETSPTVLWSKLEELYMAKSLTNTLFLWRQFYQLQMTEGQRVGASKPLLEDLHRPSQRWRER